MRARFRNIERCGDSELHIFIHGYGAVRNNVQFSKRRSQIREASLRGRVEMLDWGAGNLVFTTFLAGAWDAGLLAATAYTGGTSALVGVGARQAIKKIGLHGGRIAARQAGAHAMGFRIYRKKAEQLGDQLKSRILRLKGACETPINLYGHSLGARVIHCALRCEWGDVDLRNVVLLGGATPANSSDWDDCICKLSGKLYNAWSSDDRILALKPDREVNAGHAPIRARSRTARQRLVNKHFVGYGHDDYWRRLPDVLSRLGVVTKISA